MRIGIRLLTGFIGGAAIGCSGTLTYPSSEGLGAPPTGFAGYADLRVAPTNEQPVPADVGAFRISCQFSHMNFDDPIVFPNNPGRSHLHAYFGNTGANGNSTAESLATTGNSTCNGGIMNRSAYWVPPLMDTRTGVPVAPDSVLVYYKTGYWGIRPEDVHPAPEGLRMIAGDHTYSDPSRLQSESVYWTCFDPNIGRFPTPPVEACRAAGGESINEVVEFPQCWDGVNLDSPNHKSHMANPVDGACPADHPVAIPVITMLVFYRIDQSADARYLRLSSDMYPSSLLGGASIHGDYFGGWQEEFMNILTQHCLNPSLDCHAHLLGDGRMFY